MFVILISGMAAFCAQFSVVTIGPPQVSRDTQNAFSHRLARRLAETHGVEAEGIDSWLFQHVPLAGNVERALAEVKSSPGDDSAFKRLESLVLEEASGRATGTQVQAGALWLAKYHRADRDQFTRWIEVALKVHPRLELPSGDEWDSLTEFPERLFEVDSIRSRLKKESLLRLDQLKPDSRVFLNGFRCNPSSKVLHQGPFWLRVEAAGSVFERWVTPGPEAVVVRGVPEPIAPSRVVSFLERQKSQMLIVALGEKPVVFYQVARDGDASELGSVNLDFTTIHELALRAVPFNFQVNPLSKFTVPMRALPLTPEPVSSGGGWFKTSRPFWWLVATAAGVLGIRALGAFDSTARIEGHLE